MFFIPYTEDLNSFYWLRGNQMYRACGTFTIFGHNTLPMKHLAAALALLLTFNVQAQTLIQVSNARELVSAIGSNRVIELAEGDYNLSEIDPPENTHIQWVDSYDGNEPQISGVQNMKIISKSNARILIRPRYAWVMMFMNCNNLTFQNVTFGHTEGGYCSGGVLGFSKCQNVTISACHLYGSGTVGISFDESQNLRVISSEIFECTYALAYLTNSTNILFQKCTLRNTGEFDLVDISQCHNVTFKACVFKDNYSSKDFWNTSDLRMFNVDNTWYNPNETGTKSSTGILIQSCTFLNNHVKSFCNNKSWLTLKGNKFKGNAFTDN